MRLTVAWWVCTGGERPTPRGPRHSEVVNGVLLCVPPSLLVCWAGSRMPLLPLVGEGFRCVACCLQTARPSEGDNLVRGSPSFDLPPLCIASVWSSFVGSSLCKPHAAMCPPAVVLWAGGCGGESGDWERADRSQVGAVELRQEQLVAYGRNCGVVPGAPGPRSSSGPAA